jgi:hypothetical protein
MHLRKAALLLALLLAGLLLGLVQNTLSAQNLNSASNFPTYSKPEFPSTTLLGNSSLQSSRATRRAPRLNQEQKVSRLSCRSVALARPRPSGRILP